MSSFINIGVLGADGRMGRAVIAALAQSDAAELCAAISAPNSPNLGQDAGALAGLSPMGLKITDDLNHAAAQCDLIIDFSAPKASLAMAQIMAQTGSKAKSLVSGTTGFTADESAALLSAMDGLTLLQSGNFSPGVTALSALVEIAAQKLNAGWDIEVLDMHHRAKVDAPSGTALLLGQAAAQGRGVDLDTAKISAREGVTGPRPDGAIGFAALRGGGVIGAHEVRIATDMEMITLSHDAFDRHVFAKGAVDAALWAHAQPPGHYNMRDMLGF